ncbi:5923_t:CDS:1, partial [Gigaspora rosea]
MSPHKSRRHTRSDDMSPKENLDRFYEEHLKFLNREKKRIEIFFRKNGITGESLQSKLEELDTIIKERGQFQNVINQLRYTQQTACDLINKLHVEKREIREKCRRLERENEQLHTDLENERRITERTVLQFYNFEGICDEQ